MYGRFTLIRRKKNIDFIREYGLLENDVIEILLDLSYRDFVGGPEPDHEEGLEGDVFKFIYPWEGIQIYIKLRYDPPNNMVCISFHKAEYQKS